MRANISASDLWQFPLEDELVVARRDVQGLFLLNFTARVLWEELSGGASREEAVQTLVSVFGVSAALVRRDIEATLAHWSGGLLAPVVIGKISPEKNAAVFRDFARKPNAVRIDCVLNGRAFRVLLEAGDLVEEIGPRLARIAVPTLPVNLPVSTFRLAGQDRVFVFCDGECIAEEENAACGRVILLQEMARRCDPDRSVQVLLHAGACGTGSACVLLAGASQVGKSTLCAALMAEGLTCYSDDSAVIDHEFRVAGMPFPIMLRKSSWPVLESRFACMERVSIHRRAGVEAGFLPSNLPGNSSPAAPVKALVFVEYHADANQPDAKARLQALTAFETLVALQRSGFWVEHDRESIGRFLGWIGRLPRYRLTYSSIDEAIGAVRAVLA